MTVESAADITELVPANPAAFDAEFDEHLRLLKSTLKASFPYDLRGVVKSSKLARRIRFNGTAFETADPEISYFTFSVTHTANNWVNGASYTAVSDPAGFIGASRVLTQVTARFRAFIKPVSSINGSTAIRIRADGATTCGRSPLLSTLMSGVWTPMVVYPSELSTSSVITFQGRSVTGQTITYAVKLVHG